MRIVQCGGSFRNSVLDFALLLEKTLVSGWPTLPLSFEVSKVPDNM